MGCGIGVVASHPAEKYKWNVTGIDLDCEQIERARNDNTENEHLKFLEADATGLPFEDREFDMVLSFDVLHHMPDWNEALVEIGRVLKPEGFYVLNDLALPGFAARIFGNCAAFAADDTIDRLKRNAFEIIYAEKAKAGMFATLARHCSVVSQKAPADCLQQVRLVR